ncbi:two-component system, OmpR family, phosphate regulon response regulator PhoB/two-component system, OmpR family, alkaline phosphatase synthesis response regulator PhoP [Parapedobacter composti]|uniref:Two-component system, OmpR family, phosphate regulon response regulator PhoB/two-component system, OmpR family, alkaline phosphatase synthesis response regulator PhoP n=1 Tax=Parapedobacter composti TaxID=623281 RepID=A0A1I1JK65_9SPHI|nr:response regulator [Parapedobacter composti]SFC48886.1 two-component system, OmpR family, phosphate regulon response regulator PhoB/two-component system, OmpR family, alkaline phosphatase synthesis response regulator PhoP [Parapedobacter composti]
MKNKLLYIEDDADVSALMTEIMEYEQYEVIVDNGKSMFRILREHPIGLILLDQRLYWTTGSELCQALKANAETKHIPVIMISSAANIEAIARSCGAEDYIKKPFDMYDAIAMVAKYFRK